MSCGPGKGLANLNNLKEGALGAINGLTDGAQGIVDKLDSLSSTVDAQLGKLAGGIKGMIPEIEFPEITIPAIDLPELPEIKLPELSLQFEVGSVLAKLNSNNPLDKAQALLNLDSLKEKFPDVDIESLKADILSGKIDADTLCKLVPDIQKIDGEFITKGVPLTGPEIEPEKVIKTVLEQIDEKALQDAVDALPEAINAAELSDKVSKLTEKADELADFELNIPISF